MNAQETKGFYIVDVDNIPEETDWNDLTDEQFIELADEFMTIVFFVMAFNESTISTDTQVIRYI